MEDRIFFKDQKNELRGPYNERTIQEWYRKGWFESTLPFYFSQSDEILPTEENSEFSLDSLLARNGIGCPFFKGEGNEREFEKKRRIREEKLDSIEKEIEDLHIQCDAVLCMEKTIERMEREAEELAVPAEQKNVENEIMGVQQQLESIDEELAMLADQKEISTSDERETMNVQQEKSVQQNTDSDSKSEQKKEKKGSSKKSKSESVDEPVVLKIGNGKSTHPCYYLRLFDGTGINPDMHDVRRDFAQSSQNAKALLASGDLDKAVKEIAMAVFIDPKSEEVLNKYKKSISRDLYDRVVKHMSNIVVFSPGSNMNAGPPDCDKPPSESSKYREMRSKLSALNHKVEKRSADAEYSAHSDELLMIFDLCDIPIPHSLEISCLAVFYVEQQMQLLERLLADPSMEATAVLADDQVKEKYMKELRNIFEKTLPPKYFDLVCKKLDLIRGLLSEYIADTVTDRMEAKKEAGEDFIRRRQQLEKIFDTLPPEHFAFCRENLPAFKETLNEYLAADISTTTTRKQTKIETSKPESRKSESGQKKKEKKKKIEKPESISVEIWQQFYDLGRHVADFILDVFAMFESGDFTCWDNNRLKSIVSSLDKKNEAKKRYNRNLVCEHVLIERMKEKEFFCCAICEEVLFTYKQALIHFASNVHRKNEKSAVSPPVIDGFRRVLNSFTDLPSKLALSEFQSHVMRYPNGQVKCGHECVIPSEEFIVHMNEKYFRTPYAELDDLTAEQILSNRLTIYAEIMIRRAKSEKGRQAMDELHEHLALGKTHCVYCDCETGSRNEFYAHLQSAAHVHNSNVEIRREKEEHFPFYFLTLLVNTHREDPRLSECKERSKIN